jgi:hypothetical protein
VTSPAVAAPGTATAGAAQAGTATAWGSAWSAALDALELEVGHVESFLADDHAQRDFGWVAQATSHVAWTAPTGLPPLPAHLAGRAHDVLRRQTTAAAALALAMTANRRQSLLAGRMSLDAAGRPAYIDRAV